MITVGTETVNVVDGAVSVIVAEAKEASAEKAINESCMLGYWVRYILEQANN